MTKNKKTISALLAILIILALTIFYVTSNKSSKTEDVSNKKSIIEIEESNTYSISDETIPSINSVIGKREIASIKEYTTEEKITLKYKPVDTVISDISEYATTLNNKYKFDITKDEMLDETTGIIEFTKDAKKVDKLLTLTVTYTDEYYEITIEIL